MSACIFASSLLLCLASTKSVPPCEVASTTAVVLGGDDAGTGAAWALATLRVPTVLVLSAPRDLGGDPAWFYNDGIRAGGGGRNDSSSAGAPACANEILYAKITFV